MSRACSVCSHPYRSEINSLIRAEVPSAEISRKVGDLSADAIERHRKNHVRSDDVAQGVSSPAFAEILGELEACADVARDAGDHRSVNQIMRSKLHVLELQRRLPPERPVSGPGSGKFVEIGSIAWFDSVIEHFAALERDRESLKTTETTDAN